MRCCCVEGCEWGGDYCYVGKRACGRDAREECGKGWFDEGYFGAAFIICFITLHCGRSRIGCRMDAPSGDDYCVRIKERLCPFAVFASTWLAGMFPMQRTRMG